jgi:hypothetical protein
MAEYAESFGITAEDAAEYIYEKTGFVKYN